MTDHKNNQSAQKQAGDYTIVLKKGLWLEGVKHPKGTEMNVSKDNAKKYTDSGIAEVVPT